MTVFDGTAEFKDGLITDLGPVNPAMSPQGRHHEVHMDLWHVLSFHRSTSQWSPG